MLAGRLRSVQTTLTLRVPLPSLNPSLLQMLRTLVDPTPAATEALRGRMREVIREQLREFKRLTTGVDEVLKRANLNPTRLDAEAILARLARSLTPQRVTPPAWDPSLPLGAQALDQYVETIEGGLRNRDLYGHVLSLRAAPGRTYPGILSAPRAPEKSYPLALWNLVRQWPVTVCANVAVPSQASLKTLMEWKRGFAALQRINLFGSASIEAEGIGDELDIVLSDAFKTGRRGLRIRTHVVLWAPSEDDLRTLKDTVTGTPATSLDLQLIPEPTCGSTFMVHTTPLGFDPDYPKEREVRRARTLKGDNVADLLPLYGGFRGSGTPAVLYMNRRGEPVLFDHFDFPTGLHALVTGTTGAGKSFFVNHFVHSVLPLGASVVILDRLASYEGLCAAHGGRHIRIDFDEPVCSNIFAGPYNGEHRAVLQYFLAAMATQDETPIGAAERGVLSRALGAFAPMRPRDREPILSDFIPCLEDARFDWHEIGRQLALRLTPFYGSGQYAGFIDGPNTFAIEDRLTVFELSQLSHAPELQTVFSLALMQQLTVHFSDPIRQRRRKYLFNDEVWSLLEHPASARVLVEIARTYRKLRTSAMFISQHGRDFMGHAGEAIKGLAGIRYFLQQESDEIELMRDLFSLREAEVRVLKSVGRRQGWSEIYLRIPREEGGVVRLVPDPYLRYMATQDEGEQAAREAALAASGSDFHRALCDLAHDDMQKTEWMSA
jgi:conjugal transfer ATP-binding protein TraC